MSIDSTLPSPSSLSSPSLGFDGIPGRRRKKRTSIETNVRVALERAFMTVRTRAELLGWGGGGNKALTSVASLAEPEAYLRGDHADRRAAQHGEGGDPGVVLQPPAEGETHQPQQRHPSPSQPAPRCSGNAQTALLQPPHGKAHLCRMLTVDASV